MKTNCKIFEGCIGSDGYGRVQVNGKKWRAHRLAYTEAKGPIPLGMLVRHMCHNPACVNPDHLELGTNQDNMHDMVKAGRSCRGESVNTAKITEEQAREIWAAKPKGKTPMGYRKQLCEKYNIRSGIIDGIWMKKTWKHIHGQGR